MRPRDALMGWVALVAIGLNVILWARTLAMLAGMLPVP